jgi:hypothetical protein
MAIDNLQKLIMEWEIWLHGRDHTANTSMIRTFLREKRYIPYCNHNKCKLATLVNGDPVEPYRVGDKVFRYFICLDCGDHFTK